MFISLLVALQGGRAHRSAVVASQWPDYNITILHKKKDGTDSYSDSSDASCDGRQRRQNHTKTKKKSLATWGIIACSNLTITSGAGSSGGRGSSSTSTRHSTGSSYNLQKDMESDWRRAVTAFTASLAFIPAVTLQYYRTAT